MDDERKELYLRGVHDAFVMEIPVVCSEVYSDTEPVVRAARSSRTHDGHHDDARPRVAL